MYIVPEKIRENSILNVLFDDEVHKLAGWKFFVRNKGSKVARGISNRKFNDTVLKAINSKGDLMRGDFPVRTSSV